MMEDGWLKRYAQYGSAHPCPEQQEACICHTFPEQQETGKCHKKKSKLRRRILSLLKSCHSGENGGTQESGSSEGHGKDELLTNAGSEKLYEIYLKHQGKETGLTCQIEEPDCICGDLPGKTYLMNQGEKDQDEVRPSVHPTSNRPCIVAGTLQSEDETSVMKVMNSDTPNSVYHVNTIGRKEKGHFLRTVTSLIRNFLNSIQNKTGTSGKLVSELKIAVDRDSLEQIRIKRAESERDPNEGKRGAAQMSPDLAKSSFMRCLLSFRHFHRYPIFRSVIMTEENVFCYPTYADIEKRKDSLKNCTSQQLKQYRFEELAYTGWFFNQRALITFCCGMEMPMKPNGQPLDVHLSLSPQCEFACGILAPATGCEVATAQAEEGNLEASGGAAGFTFSIPVQATDNGSGHVFYASEGNEEFSTFSSVNAPDRFQFALASEGSTYVQGLVTNTTQLPSEDLSGDSETVQERPADRDEQHCADNGQLHMRGNYQNPLGNARWRREYEGDAVQHNHMPLFAIDQINMDGERGDDYRARYPQFGFPAIRKMTFEGWPPTYSQTGDMMAEAGFIYAGYGDSVLCYSCGINVRHWLQSDDPWIEHARWRPSCVYVLAMKGQEFIDVVRDLCCRSGSNRRRPTMQEVTTEVSRRAAARGDDGGRSTAVASP